MGRTPCCDKNGLKKGPWTPEEDQKLTDYIHKHGYGNWRTLPKNAGLQRCGKSCRLRWTNYLRPDIKRGRFSFEEEETIIQLHSILGNKWSAIASRLPGRTDNEIKNYWNTHIRKRLLRMGIDPVTHSPRLDLLDLSSILGSSLYGCGGRGTSQINLQRLLGMQHQTTMLNPEVLKFASSLLCSSQQQQHKHLDYNDHQFQNHNPQFVHLNNSSCVSSLPLTHQSQLVEHDEPNVNTYPPSNIINLTTDHTDQILGQYNWDSNHDGLIPLNTLTEEQDYNNNNIPQLVSSYNDDYCYYQNPIMDPSFSNNTNQNLSFASVMSTPSSSSPTPLDSNSSTYINGASCSTEDEREISYGSNCNNNNMFRFEVPHVLDVSDFM